MDNSNIIYFGVGALLGGVATYFLVKGKYEKEYQDYRNELLSIYRKDDTKNEPIMQLDKIEESSTDDIVNRINTLTNTNISKEIVDYSGMYDDTTYEKENNVEQKRSIFNSVEEFPTEDELPYIISEEEYADPIPANDKVTLKYFIKDDILIDEMSHEVVDVSATISEKNLTRLIDSGSDYIYVRNVNNGTDYEVEIDERDYEEAEKSYLGIF